VTTLINESPCAQPGGGGPLTYDFDRSEFWRAIPKWRDIDSETFGDFRWQQRNSVTSIPSIKETLGEKASSALIVFISCIASETNVWIDLTVIIVFKITLKILYC